MIFNWGEKQPPLSVFLIIVASFFSYPLCFLLSLGSGFLTSCKPSSHVHLSLFTDSRTLFSPLPTGCHDQTSFPLSNPTSSAPVPFAPRTNSHLAIEPRIAAWLLLSLTVIILSRCLCHRPAGTIYFYQLLARSATIPLAPRRSLSHLLQTNRYSLSGSATVRSFLTPPVAFQSPPNPDLCSMIVLRVAS